MVASSGRIPANRLYNTGIALLNRYPLPNIQQAAGTNYNYQVNPPAVENLDAAAGHPARLPAVARSCASPASTPASVRAG